MTFDPVEFARGVGDFVRAAIAKGVEALESRLSAVEAALAERPFDEAKMREIIAEAVKAIPPAKDGPSLDDMRPLIEEAVKALPTPKDGEDGKSVASEDVLPALQLQLGEAIKALPVPQDGKSVTVEEVVEALIGPVEMEIARRVERQVAAAVLDFERRAQDTLFRACERIPKPENGKDGLGFDDLQIEHDGERRFNIRMVRGDQTKEFPFRLPVWIDRGIFKEDTDYEQGDGVTFGGSFWIAQKDDPQGKPGMSDDWRLSVRKGRDK